MASLPDLSRSRYEPSPFALRGPGLVSIRCKMSHWLASMVDPLALLWLGLCGSAAWLAWKRRWRAAAVVGSPAGILFLLGSLPWPEALVAAREAPYAERNVAPAPAADAVVMLGGIQIGRASCRERV